MNQIYADNAATTPLCKEAVAVMQEYTDLYGNPSAIYKMGRDARRRLDKCRSKIAKAMGAQPEEIYFTSCGTESDNWALIGTFEAALENRRKLGQSGDQEKFHLITTAVEHHAVLRAAEYLESRGVEVTYLSVDRKGFISLDELEQAIRPETFLISIMFANNEVGTIMPIEEVGRIAEKHNIVFHTDAVQAIAHIPIDITKIKADLLSISGHKFGAPKGVGALYIKKGTKVNPFFHGGTQEQSRRAGTENTMGIAAMAAALEAAVSHMEERTALLSKMEYKLTQGICEIPQAHHTGPEGARKLDDGRIVPAEKRIAGTTSFVFENIDGERLIHLLDAKGVSASPGSACAAGSVTASEVLKAMGYEHILAQSALRLTLSWENTMEEMEEIIRIVKDVVGELSR